MKDFDPKEHMLCPVCGFETVYINPNSKPPMTAYIFKDGRIDDDTMDIDTECQPDEVEGVFCNSVKCGVKIEIPEVE